MPSTCAVTSTAPSTAALASVDVALPQDDAVVLTVAGDFDLANVGLIARRAVAALSMGRNMTIDMARAGFIDVVVADALIELHHEFARHGLQFHIRRPSRPVARLLRLIGVLSLFTDDDAETGPAPIRADHSVSVTTPMTSPNADIRA
jgi:anti-anti-sigma factor